MSEVVEPQSPRFDAEEAIRLRAECDRIMKRIPDADRDTVWQTLLLLQLPPLERLRWSLFRGRGLRANKR